ncbi:MAG TPA: cystathionine gamma-synthase family protein [Steroidobacteraceae bacterium]|nr:cystathionine gamma-synthase family protein [Steroidobacteraceae bacterium]
MVDTYHKRTVGKRTLSPQTQMMGFGYDPHLSEGALKPPVFLTSTFVFKTAQDGKDFFDYNSGRKSKPAGAAGGLIYSRFNNPNLEVLEDRLALWDRAESAAVFASGMAAIATTFLAYLKAGDVILLCQPLYGGTETLIARVLPNYGIRTVGFTDGLTPAAVNAAAAEARALGRIGMIMTETPANPTNALVDLALMSATADDIGRQQGYRPPVVTDNTMLGPLYQNPLRCGADLNVYSLTKYVGGHSDLVAGGVTGSLARVEPIRMLRHAIGTQLDPNSAWMLLRSMETLALRMERANDNARTVAAFLAGHPKVVSVNYLGLLAPDDPRSRVYARQCQAPGSTFSFEVQGGEAGAFRFLDALSVIKLAVSLGGTESLASHPAAMTHSGVPADVRRRLGISESMIRLSVGIEDAADLVEDVSQALERV